MLDTTTKRKFNSAVTAMSTQCLVHLRSRIREDAQDIGYVLLDGSQIKFDTIPQVALDSVRRAYLAILDDPKILEALKKDLAK